jgi:hypothetical protein
VDAGGGQTIHLIRTGAGAFGIKAAILAISNADWLQDWEGTLNTNSPAPTAAQYLPVKPAALLYFTCADGSVAQLRIPSPHVAVFLADQETVDSSNAGVASLITACIGHLASTTGSLATAYQAGRLESLPSR